jgi:hypothetical protein
VTAVRLVPVGGLGEFGANSMLIDDDRGRRLLVDAGASFSDLEAFGVGYEVPDFATLGERVPRHVILTHATTTTPRRCFCCTRRLRQPTCGHQATLARAAAALVTPAPASCMEDARPTSADSRSTSCRYLTRSPAP